MNFLPIMLAGLTACGKTTHGRLLSGETGWELFSASQALLQITNANQESKADFWISEQAKELNKLRKADNKYDRLVDELLIRRVSQPPPVIIESFGLPWMTNVSGLRIWIKSSLSSRTLKAIVSYKRGDSPSQHKNPVEVEKELVNKDRFIQEYFLKEYKFDIFLDHNIFDMIIDISEFITVPSIEMSNISISSSQEIISKAVNAYIWENEKFIEDWKKCYLTNKNIIKVSALSKLSQYL